MRESPLLEHWQDWYRRCTLEGCSEAGRLSLAAFTHARFLTYLRRLDRGGLGHGAPESTDRTWHLFESHLQLKATRQGKRYKDWLFARLDGATDQPAEVVEAGASLIVRSVVREYLRDERPRAGTASLDAPVVDDFGHPLTLEDLLAGPADTAAEVMARESEALARRSAVDAFAALPRRTRIVLAAKALGVSLAHPSVERLARARKSALSDEYRRCVAELAEALRARYAGEYAGRMATLAAQTLHHMFELAVEWARAEKGCGKLFSCVEG
jgi:hypothetical protein